MTRSLYKTRVTSQLRNIESRLKRFCNREERLEQVIYSFAALKDMMKKRSRHSKWKQDVINRIAEIQGMIDLFSITENQ